MNEQKVTLELTIPQLNTVLGGLAKLPIEVVDIDTHPEVAIEFGIRGVPTLVIVEDNIPSKRLVGNKTKQEIEAFIND